MYIEIVKKMLEGSYDLDCLNQIGNICIEQNDNYALCDILLFKWHLNQDNDLLLKIANLYYYELKDNMNSFKYYRAYFKTLNSKALDCFISSHNELFNPIDSEKVEEINEDVLEIKDWTILYDKYSIIAYLIIFALKQKNYEEVLCLRSLLIQLQCESFSYDNSSGSFDAFEKIANILSTALSRVEHHNDINDFAIELNPQNKKAYINILDDYITYGNYDAAVNFYNDYCSEVFDSGKCYQAENICKILSEYFSKQGNFFKSVLYLQKKFELELGKN